MTTTQTPSLEEAPMTSQERLALHRELGERVEIAISLENVSPEQAEFTVIDRALQARRDPFETLRENPFEEETR